ncbi:MAG: hypothetical protein P8Y71_29900, partial [Pseudolabrys sp.]
MRFSMLVPIVPLQEREAHLVSYYERIKNFEGCARNPFFWLQYAIARISIDDYPLAEQYLDTAYALASRFTWFDTYQLDNTKARLLLQRTIHDRPPIADAFSDFVKASQIINTQMRERRHGYYPYRVATLYGRFWDAIASKWPDEQRSIILGAVKAVQRLLQGVDRHIVAHPDVVRCSEEISRILFSDKGALR